MYDLTILIPTYKRTNELVFNIQLLERILAELKLIENVFVLICFDGSTKQHIDTVCNCLETSKLNYECIFNELNIGLEKTELLLVSKAKSNYAMLLGEDDYLNIDLFKTEYDYIKSKPNIGCIIPNYYGVDGNRKIIRSPKRRIKKDKFFQKGSLQELYKANQMSALVFRCDNVVESYDRLMKFNTVYPHLFFIGINLLNYDSIQITRYPFMNTYIKTKSFSYSAEGLLDEIISIYLAFDCDQTIKDKAIRHFLKKDRRRYCNKATWLHPKTFKNNVVNNYKNIPLKIKKDIMRNFRLSYLLIPWFIFTHFWVRIFKGKFL